jgi:hypothetical protein
MSLLCDDEWYLEIRNRRQAQKPPKEDAKKRDPLILSSTCGQRGVRITNLGFGAAGDGRAL